jgi:hypothetical protein
MLLFSCLNVLSQQQNEIRRITLTYPDSVIKTTVWDKPEIFKPVDNREYFWYYSGIINNNLGGFSGKLLHGTYEAFNNSQKLISKGFFEHGLKHGDWNFWYPNGNLRRSCSYINGQINGIVKTYDKSGTLLSYLRYKNNRLEGESKYFLKDSIIVKNFKNGIEVKREAPGRFLVKRKSKNQVGSIQKKSDEAPVKKTDRRKHFPLLKKSSEEKKDKKNEKKSI